MKDHTHEMTTEKKNGRFQGFQLLLVQSSVCVLAVLLMLLLRFVGVDIYAALALRFQEAMMGEVLVSAVDNTAEQSSILTTASTTAATQPVETVAVTQPFFTPLTGGVLTSSFGEREDPIHNGTTVIHEGMDIAAAEWTPLFALADGRVTSVMFEENGYGHYVSVLCDNGYSYLYAHCSSVCVQVGAPVKGGELIAYVGNTGRSTGSHVHIEWIRSDGSKCDPSSVVPREAYGS